ncbi:hypothetical protein AMTR_s00046p00096430 [Amborella trichopoda]|uniref:Uncharacterized protein n=1 Tax=Amborella trichopoda TaxID=13333 RepID=U5DC34_AMBTC|nr:hypothetical protein AMTR_s00046p00096430 [Amborella trichopoda]
MVEMTKVKARREMVGMTKVRLRKQLVEMRKTRLRREMVEMRKERAIPMTTMRGERRAEMKRTKATRFKLCQPCMKNQGGICDHEEREMSRSKGLGRNSM